MMELPGENAGLTAEETSRLRIELAKFLLERDTLQKQLLEALLIIGPFADLAAAFPGDAQDAAIQKCIPAADGEAPRLIRIAIGHLRWAQRWRDELYLSAEGAEIPGNNSAG